MKKCMKQMLTTPVFGSEVPVQVCAHTSVVLVDRTVLSPHSVLKEADGDRLSSWTILSWPWSSHTAPPPSKSQSQSLELLA